MMKRSLPLMLATVALPAAAPARADTAVLAGGCFWGMETVFEHVKGVVTLSPDMPAAALRTPTMTR